MPLLKVGVGCKKKTLDVATQNVNLCDICFEIFQ